MSEPTPLRRIKELTERVRQLEAVLEKERAAARGIDDVLDRLTIITQAAGHRAIRFMQPLP